MSGQVVVVGAGLAGAKTVEALRTREYDGRVVLLGGETERPYERPPLSKGYLQGSEERDERLHPSGRLVRAHDVDLRLGTVGGRDRPRRRDVVDDSGTRTGWDHLVLATGRSRAGSTCPAPTWWASSTCGRSTTATGSARG